jgi:S-DNA-T family DNA segregation ATPase FtsK/SpoIIIE
VIAALQTPRKEVMNIRNLFPDRIAMRSMNRSRSTWCSATALRDRGALADLISTDETTGAGVAYVRLATDPDPVRVRAAWVTDADIRAMPPLCPGREGAPRCGLMPHDGLTTWQDR